MIKHKKMFFVDIWTQMYFFSKMNKTNSQLKNPDKHE